jgi:uncharacterized Zn finger protein (UPF0148 family)
MDVFRIRKIRDAPSGTGNMGTLDSVHRETVQSLQASTVAHDELRNERETFVCQMKELESAIDMASVLKHSQLSARVAEIDKELAQSNPVEDYYAKNMDILIDYYGRREPAVPIVPNVPAETNTFAKFFSANVPAADLGPSRKQMFDNYIHRMKLSNGPDAVQLLTEHCQQCNVAREEISSEGILVCPRCGSEEYALVVSDFPSFRDPPKERNNYAYKKINHLNEILNQFQAKESTIIPEEVMNEVVLEIRKRRIANIADLSEEDIRQILKKLGRSKYYEHRAHILSRLNGNPPPTITPEIEEKIRAMFQEIQAPFLLYCPNDRTNFLSYSYILYKFFELLDLDEYKVYFPLLKSRDRLIAHDIIWEKICSYLRWEFIRSV